MSKYRISLYVWLLFQLCSFGSARADTVKITVDQKAGTLSVAAEDVAVSTLLRQISQNGDRLLTAEANIGDYRLDIFVQAKRAETFRKDLAFLFDHGDTPAGFYWEPLPAESLPTHKLTRSAESRNREKRLARLLRTRSADSLREFRVAAAKAKASEREAQGLDEMTAQAFLTLNNIETETLIQKGRLIIPLDRMPSKWSEKLTVQIDKNREAVRKFKEQNPNVVPPEGYQEDGSTSLELTFQPSRDTPGTYLLQADTLPQRQGYTTGRLMDPLGIFADSKSGQHGRLDESEPSAEVNIARALEREKYPADLTTRLRLLAEAARVNIYCEKFPTSKRMRARFASQGKLHVLLNEIARDYKYSVVRQGDTYFLWSRTWFLERPNLVPESLLARFREQTAKGEAYRLEDLIEAAKLTEGQQDMLSQMPLEPEVRVQGILNPLRLLGGLTGTQRAQAYQPEGLSVDQMTSTQRAALQGKNARTASAFRLEEIAAPRGVSLRGTVKDGDEWRELWHFWLHKKPAPMIVPLPRPESPAAAPP